MNLAWVVNEIFQWIILMIIAVIILDEYERRK